MRKNKSKGSWITIYTTPREYVSVIEAMDAHVTAMIHGEAEESIWILRHSPTYTTTERSPFFAPPPHIPVVNTHRGGLTTYHDEGQVIIYAMLRLFRRALTVREYIMTLEQWGAALAKYYGITVEHHEDIRGVWVHHPLSQEAKKIASVGVRIRHGVAFHGLSFNFATNLHAFSAISPCGLSSSSMTSLQDFGVILPFEKCAEDIKRLCPFEAS